MHTKVIVPDPDSSTHKLLLLEQNINNDNLSTLPEEAIAEIKEKQIPIVEYQFEVGYDDLSADEVFKKLIPDKLIPSSFETIGKPV